MRRRSILYFVAVALVTACNRDVTAPRALEMADDAEQQLSQNWNAAVLGQLTYVENSFNPFWPNRDSTVIRLTADGESDHLTAAVIERVFIPPRGHGAPISRRSLIAWRHDSNYGILAATETNADESGAIANYGFDNDVLHPRPQFLAPRANEQDWWLGRVGKVSIEPEKTGDRCPFGNGGGDADDDKSGRVTCNVVMYAVTLDGELRRQLDIRNGLLPEALKPPHHISVPTQRVNGIRFTVRCHPTELIVDPRTPIYSGCVGSPIMFWRSDTLFARSLGVDLGQTKNLLDGHSAGSIYGRTLLEGSQKGPVGSHMLRWTLWQPDGTLVERDSTLAFPAVPEEDSPWLEQCTRGLGYGGRRQCLVVPFGHPKVRSQYDVFVVDVEDVARQ